MSSRTTKKNLKIIADFCYNFFKIDFCRKIKTYIYIYNLFPGLNYEYSPVL